MKLEFYGLKNGLGNDWIQNIGFTKRSGDDPNNYLGGNLGIDCIWYIRFNESKKNGLSRGWDHEAAIHDGGLIVYII